MIVATRVGKQALGNLTIGDRLAAFRRCKMSLMALNCRRSRRLSRQLSGVQRTRLPKASAAASDPSRHVAPLSCCCAK